MSHPDEPPECRQCERDAVRDGLCMKHWREHHRGVATDGGRSVETIRSIGTAADVLRPEWAADLTIGDIVVFESPAGVLEEPVIGFSLAGEVLGQPVVDVPAELSGFLDPADVLVLREEDVVDDDGEEPDAAPDGGSIGFLCHYCGSLCDGLGAAVACCSDEFDDSELVADGGAVSEPPAGFEDLEPVDANPSMVAFEALGTFDGQCAVAYHGAAGRCSGDPRYKTTIDWATGAEDLVALCPTHAGRDSEETDLGRDHPEALTDDGAPEGAIYRDFCSLKLRTRPRQANEERPLELYQPKGYVPGGDDRAKALDAAVSITASTWGPPFSTPASESTGAWWTEGYECAMVAVERAIVNALTGEDRSAGLRTDGGWPALDAIPDDVDEVRITGRVTLTVESVLPRANLQDEEHARNVLKGGFYETRSTGIEAQVDDVRPVEPEVRADGGDARGYDRDGGGVVLVPAAADPFVDESEVS